MLTIHDPLFFCLGLLVLVILFSQHFQRDIVRGVEGYIVTGSKQVEIGEFARNSSFIQQDML